MCRLLSHLCLLTLLPLVLAGCAGSAVLPGKTYPDYLGRAVTHSGDGLEVTVASLSADESARI